MRPAYLRGLFMLSSLLLALVPQVIHASASRSTEIRVSLFGQPCILQGPFEERALKQIHSLSPEQLYPERDINLGPASTRKALEKLHAISGAPAGLDRYRERLGKRLDAQLALLEAFTTFRKDKKSAPILTAGKTYLSGKHQKDFETAVKKSEAAKTLTKGDTLEMLFDAYGEGIENDPEEEFHRAIQRMSVQYTCSFEEHGDLSGGDDAAD